MNGLEESPMGHLTDICIGSIANAIKVQSRIVLQGEGLFRPSPCGDYKLFHINMIGGIK